MDATSILSADEIKAVLADLRRRAKRSVISLENLVIFRASCCCGLRCKEIGGLEMRDVTTGGTRPVIRIRKEITKGRPEKRKGRLVPLWWDSGTLEDFKRWIEVRKGLGARDNDPFFCAMHADVVGQRLPLDGIADRWQTAIRVLGEDRVRQLSIHKGRHSFCSHALNGGRSLVEVRDAAGHRNINTTSIYAHLIEREGVPDLFR